MQMFSLPALLPISKSINHINPFSIEKRCYNHRTYINIYKYIFRPNLYTYLGVSKKEEEVAWATRQNRRRDENRSK